LLEHVVVLGQQLKVTRGRKLRADGPVVATNIHQPTASSRLNDGVRVISRSLKAAHPLLGPSVARAGALFRDRSRSAKHLAKQIIDAARTHGTQADELRKSSYARLLAMSQATLQQGARVAGLLSLDTSTAAQRLAERLGQFMPRLQQVLKAD
jgi:IS5 family transposase